MRRCLLLKSLKITAKGNRMEMEVHLDINFPKITSNLEHGSKDINGPPKLLNDIQPQPL